MFKGPATQLLDDRSIAGYTATICSQSSCAALPKALFTLSWST